MFISAKLDTPRDDAMAFIKAGIRRQFEESLLSLSSDNLIVWEGLILILCFLIFGWTYKNREKS